jgi:hypothetical protein
VREEEFRRVNTTLDKTPHLGPIPLDLILPWGGVCIASYFLGQIFSLSWIWIISLIFWGCATWWLLTAQGAWKYLAKFVKSPNLVRGRGTYKSFLSGELEEISDAKDRKAKIQRRKR